MRATVALDHPLPAPGLAEVRITATPAQNRTTKTM
jgi:hypothetical protein